MITKPEHAIPNCSGAAHNMLLDETCKGIEFPPWFTGSECAEIARAYAQANALWRNADTIPERRTLSVEVDAWLAKFKEWETI